MSITANKLPGWQGGKATSLAGKIKIAKKVFQFHHLLLTQEVATLTDWPYHRLQPLRLITFFHMDDKVFRAIECGSDQVGHGCVHNYVLLAPVALPNRVFGHFIRLERQGRIRLVKEA